MGAYKLKAIGDPRGDDGYPIKADMLDDWIKAVCRGGEHPDIGLTQYVAKTLARVVGLDECLS